ncbi:MAG: hypothetical protein ACO3MW_10305 [Rhodospirillales bacterium]|jgi:hypothetical protein
MTEPEKKHLFDDQRNVKRVVLILFVLCGLSFVAEMFVHLHPKHPWESVFNFYSLYGLMTCIMLVLIAKMLRFFIMRREDYYDE